MSAVARVARNQVRPLSASEALSTISSEPESSDAPLAGSEIAETCETPPPLVEDVAAEVLPEGLSGHEQDGSCGPCAICLEAPRTVRLSPCGHSCLCEDCFQKVMSSTKECPMCRSQASGYFQGDEIQKEDMYVDLANSQQYVQVQCCNALRVSSNPPALAPSL
jgi:hypothetical protein